MNRDNTQVDPADLGQIVARDALPGAMGTQIKSVIVTEVPSSDGSGGRRKYKGRLLKYSVNEQTEKFEASLSGTTEIEFYNTNESSHEDAKPFLIIHDEVPVFKSGKVYITSQEPRGYI